MLADSIINFHELPPGHLCSVIANKFHFPVNHLADQVMTYFNVDRQEDALAPAVADLQQLLFGKMQTEISQLIRRETTVIFPVIRNASALNKDNTSIQPNIYEGVQQSFQKVLLLLQKLRLVSGNYQLQAAWSPEYKLCVSDMFVTEQLLQQWIYVAQNILYPAAVPGHTAVIVQHEINHIIID